jgi:site-specific recombinase XerD
MLGPLAAYHEGLWADLLGHGYSPLSARNLVRVAAHLSRWLELKRVSPSDLTVARIDAFLRHRRSQGYTSWRSAKGLAPILNYLRGAGAIPPAPPPPSDDSPGTLLLGEYRTYLLQERRLQSSTAANYLHEVRRFVEALRPEDLGSLARLSTEAVTRFLVAEVRSSSSGRVRLKVTALRSLLRYLHVRGFARDLSGAVPAVAGHRFSGLPKALPEEEVRRLLDSCDRRTPTGRRDFAILLLLGRLGLRAGEAAALELADIRWAQGEIRVRGKGTEGALPLPQDVGDALAGYLKRGRPTSTSPRLFVQARAPYREFTAGTVGAVVGSASLRAGLPPRGAHRLRHSVATQMLRKGASLPEVAQVLRHRSLDTTAIYAKVDRRALRSLARPWPGGTC